MDNKAWTAKDLAGWIVENEDTDVTMAQVEAWDRHDLQDWLNAWGYHFDGERGGWVLVEEGVTSDSNG